MKHAIVIVSMLAAACGSSGGSKNPDSSNGSGDGSQQQLDAAIDSPPAMQMITISGTVTEQTIGGPQALAGATVGAYRASNETTPVATATSDAMGNFTMTVNTGGVALDGFLKGTKATYTDTYLYSTGPIATDFTGVPVNMLKTSNFQLLFTLTGVGEVSGKGVIALEILDGPLGTGNPVAGATITTTQAAPAYKYDGTNGLPSSTATSTSPSGRAYAMNATPGATTVSATKTGTTFVSHSCKAFADSLTTTFVTP